jgi:sulfatase modifying factor 1
LFCPLGFFGRVFSLMHRIFASLILVCSIFFVSPLTASAQVTMAWSYVGNPGNAADSTVMNDGTSGYGSVPYSYNIGTYDVTVSQYVDFLNAKDPTGSDPLGLYNSNMTTPGVGEPEGGVNYDAGAVAGSKYSVVPGDGNHPIVYETWFSAIRFANWLNNGQGNGDTETGAYTLVGGTPTPSNANSIVRNPDATIFLPSENEWYKAAYYNPVTNSYYQYPTSSNTAPTATGPTSVPNSANYNNVVGGPTSVGDYTGTTSPYGAYDMGGNVWQWNELISGSDRGLRGGSFSKPLSLYLLSSMRSDMPPADDISSTVGFRVASIPEPSTVVLAVLACGMIWWWRRRLR